MSRSPLYQYFRGAREEKVQLDNCADFIKSLDTFVFFTNNVDCAKSSSFSRREDPQISICVRGLEKAFESFNIKALKPTRNLCLRMLKQGRGFTKIHLLFLKKATNYGYSKLAKQLIETKALPEMQGADYAKFLFQCGLVSIQLRNYQQAQNFLEQIMEFECSVETQRDIFLYTKLFLILQKVNGEKSISKHKLERLFMGMMSESDDPYSRRREKIGLDMLGEDLEILMDEKEKPLTPQVIEKLSKDDGIAHKLLHINDARVRKQGWDYTKQGYERMRMNEICGKELRNPANMISFNTPSILGRFDSKNQILTFKGENSDFKQNIDRLVSQSYQMYEILSSSSRSKQSSGGGGSGLRMISRRSHGNPF